MTQLQKIQEALPGTHSSWVYQREWYFSPSGSFMGMWR